MRRADHEQQTGENYVTEFKDRLVSLVGFTPKTLPGCLLMFYGALWSVPAPLSAWEADAILAQWVFNTHGVQAIDALRRLQGDEPCVELIMELWVATEPEILNPRPRIY